MKWMIEVGLKRRGEPAPGQLELMILGSHLVSLGLCLTSVPIPLSSRGQNLSNSSELYKTALLPSQVPCLINSALSFLFFLLFSLKAVFRLIEPSSG